jgi:dihydroflavonol-4-reductase
VARKRKSITLVTGASGFLGLHLVKVLLEAGHQVRTLGRRENARLDALGVDQHIGSVTDPEVCATAVGGVRQVYHVAGAVSRNKDDSGPLYAVHVNGTRNILQASLDTGVKEVLVVSTSGTIGVGRGEDFIARESSPIPWKLIGQWPYYESKAYAEREVKRFVDLGLPVKMVRPTLLLGPGDHGGSSTGDVVKFLCGDVKAGLPGGMSMVDVRDVAEILPRVMKDGRVGVGYLLGAHNCEVREFLVALEQVSGVSAPAFTIPTALTRKASGLLKRVAGLTAFGGLEEQTFEMGCHYWYIDSSAAAAELGFEPRDWMETLSETVKDLRQIGAVRAGR